MRAARKAFNQMLTSCLLAVVASPAIAQSPEMARLAKALAGDWSAVEVVQFGKPVPPGAGRKGTTHVHPAGGGMVLVDEGHAVGTVRSSTNMSRSRPKCGMSGPTSRRPRTR